MSQLAVAIKSAKLLKQYQLMVDQHEDSIAKETREWLLRGLAKPNKTQIGLALAAGVSKQAITKWVKTGHISKENLPKAARYLEESLPEWLSGNARISNSSYYGNPAVRYVNLLDIEDLRHRYRGNTELQQQIERFNQMLKDGKLTGEVLKSMLDLVDKVEKDSGKR
uniref:Helix-turn-helix n=1 Tax=Candidatus Kentrum sp. LFY TaxID=2126342 RepID=A0A450WC07_9GAMM|nr:MAG: Helix-turn-helix [Candidatus Kentron sp. LFY]